MKGGDGTLGPFLAGLLDVLLGVVSVLEHAPFLGQEALKEVLPPDLVLPKDGSLDAGGESLVDDGFVVSPLLDTVEQGLLNL